MNERCKSSIGEAGVEIETANTIKERIRAHADVLIRISQKEG
jgi:hypothetical protein